MKKRYLELILDQSKPEKPELELKVHETVEVDEIYARSLISYQVEADERAHAYLGMPLQLERKTSAIAALHAEKRSQVF